MLIYDKANELALLITKSKQFLEYKELKDAVYSDEGNKKLIKEYKSLQFKVQTAYMTGANPDEYDMQKMQKLGEVLQFNEQISNFMMAEYSFNTMVGDIYKIIGEACEIDIDMFKE